MAHVSLKCQFLMNMLMTFRNNKINMVVRACLFVCVCACVTWSRLKAPESTFLLSFLIFTSWKGQSWKPNTCVKGYFTAVQRYYTSIFFVCALGSPFILTSGLSSQNGRTSVFLLSWNLEGSTLCDIEVKTHVYLLTVALIKIGEVSMHFFQIPISGHLQIFEG